MWQTAESLECVLLSHEKAKKLKRVVSLTEESVVGKGENYCSDLLRITAEVVLRNGEIIQKTYLLKAIPTAEMRKQLVKSNGLYEIEIKVYYSILPEMERLMESANDWREPLWSHCLAADVNKGLLIEDLRPLGYKLADRRKGLDMQHAKLCLSSLARFHAMSVILEDKQIIIGEDYAKFLFSSYKNQFVLHFATTGVDSISDVIESTWPKSWLDIAKRLRSLTGGGLMKKMYEVGEQKEDKFLVLNHGDCWVNNMMFKYDIDSGEVCGIRFIDFQICHWNSPAFDLQYFLRTSLRVSLVKEHYDDLLNCYHHSLLSTFKFYKHEPKNLLTFNQLKDEMERVISVGLFGALMILPTILAATEDTIDLEEVMSSIDENAKPSIKPYIGEEFTKEMMLLLPQFQNKNIF